MDNLQEEEPKSVTATFPNIETDYTSEMELTEINEKYEQSRNDCSSESELDYENDSYESEDDENECEYCNKPAVANCDLCIDIDLCNTHIYNSEEGATCFHCALEDLDEKSNQRYKYNKNQIDIVDTVISNTNNKVGEHSCLFILQIVAVILYLIYYILHLKNII